MGNSRAATDRRVLEAMGLIFCKAHHSGEKDACGLCPSCRATVEETLARTAVCPFNHEGNCQDCAIHCQRGEARERIREIMRYAAPRMVLRHPLMTAEYLRRKAVGRKGL
ncbi:MAG: nitrous oxide-stimulated promoter family protein [Eggerthellaceae bacterium]|nr:nitrous oxide-stimulated promoter family protein [Eggerthellaceae bacterium]